MSVDKQTLENFSSRDWRLNNTYWITSDMDGETKKMCFTMTDAQRELYDNMHNKNIILKSRQHGITTFMVLLMLDSILYNHSFHCGFVAQDRDSAEDIFYKKVLYAYDNLPEGIRRARPALRKSGKMLVIDHGNGSTSSLRVGTSLRSGTYSYIHISEYGKICAKDPQKASEIISGCLNAGVSCVVTIESTAEGNFGRFFDICQRAEFHEGELTSMDYQFFFFGWTRHRGNILKCADFDYSPDLVEYFADKNLTRDQMNWYSKKRDEQGDLMKQEFPTTPAEAFEQSMEGSYYLFELRKARNEKRISEEIVYNPNYAVHTAWDLGIDDYTAVWLFQHIGDKYCFIDYFELSDRSGLPGGVSKLESYPYNWGSHIGPHDIKVTEFGTGMSRVEIAQQNYGLAFEVAPKLSIADGIEASRRILSSCCFNSLKCEIGLSRLTNYRKQFDDKRQIFVARPEHDDSSHGADSFRTFAVACNLIEETSASHLMLEEACVW